MISLYDDERIMEELSEIYGELAIASYVGMLQTACDAYSEGYFEEKFVGLVVLIMKIRCFTGGTE